MGFLAQHLSCGYCVDLLTQLQWFFSPLSLVLNEYLLLAEVGPQDSLAPRLAMVSGSGQGSVQRGTLSRMPQMWKALPLSLSVEIIQ